MSFGTLPSSTAVANPSVVVTPTSDEDEQASFCPCDDDDQRQISLHQKQCAEQEPLLPSLELESMADASLPSFPFYQSLVTPHETLKCYTGHGQEAFERITSLARVVADASHDILQESHLPQPQEVIGATDVMGAARILCNFKNDPVPYYPRNVADVVAMAVEMMADETKQRQDEEDDGMDDHGEEQHFWEPPQGNVVSTDSLFHPNRLATEEDHEEVNKLHQYVRKDLLEIFVVPQAVVESADSEEDEDDKEDSSEKKQYTATATDTRQLVTRQRSIPISSVLISPFSTAHRHYPGRVGLRCVHCANVRRKPTSKAAFYPLRLKNIYREVCAWQRIHFKNCPHVPVGVRERYDHYKRIDTSRGKVRYWESSARRIGLRNNPHRNDGIVFTKTARKA